VRWELFLPPAKRRWGWYVLPIVFRDRLVGRIERAGRLDWAPHLRSEKRLLAT
jgi:uncharacterized protein YcaQ